MAVWGLKAGNLWLQLSSGKRASGKGTVCPRRITGIRRLLLICSHKCTSGPVTLRQLAHAAVARGGGGCKGNASRRVQLCTCAALSTNRVRELRIPCQGPQLHSCIRIYSSITRWIDDGSLTFTFASRVHPGHAPLVPPTYATFSPQPRRPESCTTGRHSHSSPATEHRNT